MFFFEISNDLVYTACAVDVLCFFDLFIGAQAQLEGFWLLSVNKNDVDL